MVEFTIISVDSLGAKNLGTPISDGISPLRTYHQEQGRRHKRLTDWTRQMLHQVRRWLPTKAIIVVADSSFAALDLLGTLVKMPTPIHIVTRLRLDAQLYRPAPPRVPGTMGRPRKVGQRLPGLKRWSIILIPLDKPL